MGSDDLVENRIEWFMRKYEITAFKTAVIFLTNMMCYAQNRKEFYG